VRRLTIACAFLLALPTNSAYAGDVVGTGGSDGAKLRGRDATQQRRDDIASSTPSRKHRPAKRSRVSGRTAAVPAERTDQPCTHTVRSFDDASRGGQPRCAPVPEDTVPSATRRLEQITATAVRREIVDVPFPKLRVHIQPNGRTLVNLDTNIYTNPVRFQRTVPVLTWPVRVRATPVSYTWHFGDGTSKTTTSPGSPYPDTDVTHKYLRRIPEGASVYVTVNYAARFRAPGSGWQEIPDLISVTGPPTTVQVCEARPVLVDPNNTGSDHPPVDPNNPCTQ
jgi:hypothetical protein